MMRRTQAFALLVCVALPAAAFADAKSEAKERVAKATALHAEGRFGPALEELQIAYTLDPKPELLYAIGQLHVKLGQCDQAVLFYKRFLDAKPKKSQAAAAKEAIATCKKHPKRVEGERDKKPPPPEEPPPAPEPAAPAPAPATEPAPPAGADPGPFGSGRDSASVSASVTVKRRPWYTDVIGDLCVGVGVAAGVGGTLLYVAARSDIDDAQNAPTWDEHDKFYDTAHRKRLWAAGLGAGALVFVGVGVGRYIFGDRKVHEKEKRELVIAPDGRGGGVIGLAGRF